MGGSAYCPFFCIAEGQHKQQQQQHKQQQHQQHKQQHQKQHQQQPPLVAVVLYPLAFVLALVGRFSFRNLIITKIG
jgi:C4-dicarboxylate transporter